MLTPLARTELLALLGVERRDRRCRTGGYLTIVGRAGVRPDSVQVLDGMLSWRLPTSVTGVALYRFAFPSGTVPARG